MTAIVRRRLVEVRRPRFEVRPPPLVFPDRFPRCRWKWDRELFPALGAVTFDASSNVAFANWNAAPPFDTTSFMTVGSGAQRAMVLCVGCGSSGTGFPAGFALTWDQGGSNQSPAQISGTFTTNTGNGGTCALYGLLAPTSGAKTLRLNWTSGTHEFHVAAVAFTGVDQTSNTVAFPHGALVTHTTATASPASVTVTSATGNKVVGFFQQNSVVFGARSGTTIAVDNAVGPNEASAANFDNGAATVALTAAFAGTASWDAIGCDVLAAAAGTTTVTSNFGVRSSFERVALRDRLVPDFVLAQSRKDALTLTETATSETARSARPVDVESGRRRDSAFAAAVGRAVLRDAVDPLDYTGFSSSVARNHVSSIETGRVANRDHSPRVETVALLARDVAALIDASRIINRQGAGSIEVSIVDAMSFSPSIDWTATTAVIARNTVVPIEFTQAIFIEEIPLDESSVSRRAYVVSIEWGGSAAHVVVRDGIVPIAFSSLRTANSQVPIEPSSGVARGSLGVIEFSTGARRDGAMPVDIARIAMSSRDVPGEIAGSAIQRSAADPIDFSLSVGRTNAAPLDREAIAQGGSAVPTEWLTLATIFSVSRSAASAIEFGAGRVGSRSVPTDPAILTVIDRRTPVELVGLIRSATPSLVESGSLSRLNVASAIEFELSRIRSTGNIIGIVGSQNADRSTPIELVGLIRTALTLPDESSLAGKFDGKAAIDIGAGRLGALIVPTALSLAVARAGIVPVDFIRTVIAVARSVLTAIEWESRRATDARSNIASAFGRSLSLITPLEIKSVSTSVGASYVVLVEIAPHLRVIGFATASDVALFRVTASDAELIKVLGNDVALIKVVGTDV